VRVRLLVPLILLLACTETGVTPVDDDDVAPVDDDDDDATDDDDAVDDDDAAPTCTDRFEPNDDADGAASIDPSSYPELWACPDEDDWFRLDLRVFDTFLFDVFFDGDHGDVDLFVYDDEGTMLRSATSTDSDEHVIFEAQETGTYYAVVSLVEDRGDEGAEYLLNLQIDPSHCVEDGWEPNPTFTQSPFMFPHPWWNMVTCVDDEDWFETARWAGPLLQLWAYFDPAEGDVNIAIHDGTTGEMLVESRGTGGEEYVEWLMDDGPPYSMRVWMESDSGRYYGNVYDLLMEQTYPDGCFRDAFEFNDGQPWAWPLANGTYPGLHACASDSDWFRVVAVAGDVLEFDVAEDTSEGEVTVGLFDSSVAPIGTVTSSPGAHSVVYTMPTSGSVFFEIAMGDEAGSTLGTPYTLELTGQSPVCYPDTWEPNNELIGAAGLALDPLVGMTVCGDDDWFNRLVVQDDTITVTVTNDPADGELALRLHDGGGNVLGESTGGGGTETVTHTVGATQFVFVEIEHVADVGGLPGVTYDLTATITP